MRCAAILAICVASAVPFASVARAEQVMLVSKDGYTQIEGDLLRVDDDMYVVATSVGQIKIPVADVRCEGAGCPDLAAAQAAPSAPAALTQSELSQEQQLELFRAFLEWRKNNEDFQEFLEWRKKNAAN